MSVTEPTAEELIDVAGWWTPVRFVLDKYPSGIGDPSNENIVHALMTYKDGDGSMLEALDLTASFERDLIAAVSV